MAAVSVAEPASARLAAQALPTDLFPGPVDPAPVGPATFRVRTSDQAFFVASSQDPALAAAMPAAPSVPGTPAGVLAYPQIVRPDRRRLDAELWQRLVRDGQARTSRQLRQGLWGAGVGTKAAGMKGQDKQMSDATFRLEVHEWAMRHRIPLRSYGEGRVEGESGYRVARDRKEVEEYADSLNDRATAIDTSGGAIAANVASWSGVEAWQPPTVAGWSRGDLKALVADLEERQTKGAAIAKQYLGAQSDEEAGTATARVRALIQDLRAAGVPILANGRGYWVSTDRDDALAYLASLTERISAIREHARAVERSGALWYPNNPVEHEERRQWVSRVWKSEPSDKAKRDAAAKSLARETGAVERRERAEREFQDQLPQVETRMEGLRETHDLVVEKGRRGNSLTQTERSVKTEVEWLRKYKRTKSLPPVGLRPSYLWLPERVRADAERASRTRRTRR